MIHRKRAGYVLVVVSLCALIGALLWMGLRMDAVLPKRLISMAITLLPLLIFVRGAVMANMRSYQALALLAPVYFFIGGVVWLWASAGFGAWICAWALVMEAGAIAHNFRRRSKHRPAGRMHE